MAETEASAASLRIEDWTQTPWRTLERHVFRLQKRIYVEHARREFADHYLDSLTEMSKAWQDQDAGPKDTRRAG